MIRTIASVVAERLIGLEAAVGELGQLYVVARGFAALRADAERSLLPQTAALAAELRRHVRRQSLDDDAIDLAAQRIAHIRREWHERLEQLRTGTLYQRCLAAWDAGRRDELLVLLPQLIPDLEPADHPAALFYAVSPASGRRRPGTRPFLTPAACADTIASYQRDGIPIEPDGHEWWNSELRSLSLARDADDVDTPVALQLDPTSITLPMFAVSGERSIRVFGTALQARFGVLLQDEATDEWWQAFDESYEHWRKAVAQELRQRGIEVQ